MSDDQPTNAPDPERVKVYHFAIYEADTGRVVRSGSGTNPAIYGAQTLRDGEALYEGQIDPNTQYLPAGTPAPKPDDYRSVDPSQVKAWAGRILSYTDWYVTRDLEGGGAMPETIQVYRQAVRDRSGEIEAMAPIPADYRDPKWWPIAP